MDFILEGAGLFIYPLGLCSFVALFVIIERLISLRTGRIIPRKVADALVSGNLANYAGDQKTSVGRIIYFCKTSNPDCEAIKAYAQLEMSRLEKGMFLLDVAISAAPLLGLMGTVAGLVSVFSVSDMPSQETISRGVGLALSTTLLGLAIAIPSILGSSFLYRRIDTLCARINICVERLIDLQNNSKLDKESREMATGKLR